VRDPVRCQVRTTHRPAARLAMDGRAGSLHGFVLRDPPRARGGKPCPLGRAARCMPVPGRVVGALGGAAAKPNPDRSAEGNTHHNNAALCPCRAGRPGQRPDAAAVAFLSFPFLSFPLSDRALRPVAPRPRPPELASAYMPPLLLRRPPSPFNAFSLLCTARWSDLIDLSVQTAFPSLVRTLMHVPSSSYLFSSRAPRIYARAHAKGEKEPRPGGAFP
jgi:hypothetical protein